MVSAILESVRFSVLSPALVIITRFFLIDLMFEKWHLIVSVCISVTASEIEYLFMTLLLVIHVYSYIKHHFTSFANFFIMLLIICIEALSISSILIFCPSYVLKIFFINFCHLA